MSLEPFGKIRAASVAACQRQGPHTPGDRHQIAHRLQVTRPSEREGQMRKEPGEGQH